MTEKEQIKRMRLLILGNTDNELQDDLFKMSLDDAKAVILNTLYPFNHEINEINANDFRLRNWQVRCAIELYKSIEREGIESYSENGFSVKYLTSLISTSLMGELVPKAGCPKENENDNEN